MFAAGLGTSLLLMPLARLLARRWGLVDRPDGRRKLHGQAVPVSGGLAVLAATVGVLGAGRRRAGPARRRPGRQGPRTAGPAARGRWSSAPSASPTTSAACAAGTSCSASSSPSASCLAFGVRIDSVRLFDWHLDLGLLAVPFTLFWLLGAINALNLLDGMDGLLGSVGGIVSLALGAMALMQGDAATAAVAVALAGALLGFLRYNFPPATVFLGDCGSMLIGLAVGVLAIQSSLKGPATRGPGGAGGPAHPADLRHAAAILRRKLTGRSIYTTDRGHLHHCLLRRGLSRPVGPAGGLGPVPGDGVRGAGQRRLEQRGARPAVGGGGGRHAWC